MPIDWKKRRAKKRRRTGTPRRILDERRAEAGIDLPTTERCKCGHEGHYHTRAKYGRVLVLTKCIAVGCDCAEFDADPRDDLGHHEAMRATRPGDMVDSLGGLPKVVAEKKCTACDETFAEHEVKSLKQTISSRDRSTMEFEFFRLGCPATATIHTVHLKSVARITHESYDIVDKVIDAEMWDRLTVHSASGEDLDKLAGLMTDESDVAGTCPNCGHGLKTDHYVALGRHHCRVEGCKCHIRLKVS